MDEHVDHHQDRSPASSPCAAAGDRMPSTSSCSSATAAGCGGWWRLRLDPRLQGRVDASDVIQEGYLDAMRRLDEYIRDPSVPFYLWLRFLVGQRVHEQHRRHLGTPGRDAGREVSLYRGAMPGASTGGPGGPAPGQADQPQPGGGAGRAEDPAPGGAQPHGPDWTARSWSCATSSS